MNNCEKNLQHPCATTVFSTVQMKMYVPYSYNFFASACDGIRLQVPPPQLGPCEERRLHEPVPPATTAATTEAPAPQS